MLSPVPEEVEVDFGSELGEVKLTIIIILLLYIVNLFRSHNNSVLVITNRYVLRSGWKCFMCVQIWMLST